MPPMRRRRFLHLGAIGVSMSVAGCSAPDATTTPLDDRQVTTTSGDRVEITHAQVVIRDDLDGPAVQYTLRNTGTSDETVAVRTVLAVDGGRSFDKSVYLTIPGGDEMTAMYVIVDTDDLTDTERQRVRNGVADFETYLNGERRLV